MNSERDRLVSKRKELLRVLVTLGGLVGTFLSVFDTSPPVATAFSIFIISSVTLYCLFLFELHPEKKLYAATTAFTSFSFAALMVFVVERALNGSGYSWAGVIIVILYGALGFMLLYAFNFKSKTAEPPA